MQKVTFMSVQNAHPMCVYMYIHTEIHLYGRQLSMDFLYLYILC